MNQRHTHKYAVIYPIQYAICNDQNIRELEFMYGKYNHYREFQTNARRGVSSLHLESNSQHSCQTDDHRATEDTHTSEDDQMRETTMILGNERRLNRETRQTSKADDSLIHPEPGTERLDRSEFCNTGHEDADTGTGWETCHCAEREHLGVRGGRVYFKGKPEGEQYDGVEEGDDWDGVEAAKAVGEVGGKDPADDWTATGKGVRNIYEEGERERGLLQHYYRIYCGFIGEVMSEGHCGEKIPSREESPAVLISHQLLHCELRAKWTHTTRKVPKQ